MPTDYQRDECESCREPLRADRPPIGRWCCRVWFYVDSSAGSDRCWPWTGATNRDGYGFLSRPGRGNSNMLAHRALYELVAGPIPTGAVLMHICDVPACCNPEHLRPASQRENLHDAISKGRMVPPPARRGEQHSAALLTEEKVRQIRRLRGEGLIQREIAKRIGVSRGAACSVLTGQSWRHVDG